MTTTLKGTIRGGVVVFSASPATAQIISDSRFESTDSATSFSFIPPESVRVIKCEMDADSQSGAYEGNLGSSSNSWVSVTGYGSSDTSTSYVGVTPKKTYKLQLTYESDFSEEVGGVSVVMSWSSEINKIPPTVTDY